MTVCHHFNQMSNVWSFDLLAAVDLFLYIILPDVVQKIHSHTIVMDVNSNDRDQD